ncbi:MAG: hypothetical protein AAGF28_02785 [Pseudomonadota bacterium]
MGTLFWAILGTAGVVLILLIASGDTGTVLGIDSDRFAVAATLSLWGVLIGSAVLSRGVSFQNVLQNIAIWLVVLLVLVTAYVHIPALHGLGQ